MFCTKINAEYYITYRYNNLTIVTVMVTGGFIVQVI